MKKILKTIMYIILTIFLLIIIILYGFKFIDYYFFSIKPEYNNLTKKELKELKEKTTPSEKDLLENINDYNKLKEYLLENNHYGIRKEIDGEIYIHKIKSNDNFYNKNYEIFNLLDINGIYSISNYNLTKKGLFDNGMIFIKHNIRMERGSFSGYLYYEGEIPKIIYENNANYKKDKIIKINDNWLMFDIQYIYN